MIYNYSVAFKICRVFFRNFKFKISKKNTVFLTFDDGPNPETTPYILEILRQYGAQATFFCTGSQIQKYPELFVQILEEGHTVGNHGYEHLDGWKTPDNQYVSNAMKTNEIYPFKLYRPPYGRMTFRQYRRISKLYTVILWSFMTGDYQSKYSMDLVFHKMKSLNSAGKIIVFHDSLKAAPQMKHLLPLYLSELTARKIQFGTL